MISSDEKVESDRKLLHEAHQKGTSAVVGTYLKLSGPGWLQSAITLGGGSLTGSLYLGVLGGFSLLWLQPIAMIFGIVMLGAIGYVTMSTGQRPFRAINEHINPVLGWGWAIASLLASMVWALPQYSLATGVLQQNLFPGILGAGGALGDFNSKLLIAVCILVFSTAVTWSYGGGSLGVKLYELMLKLMVAVIVICFALVVVKLAISPQGMDWGALFGGFIPDFGAATRPAAGFEPLLAAVEPESRAFWSQLIVEKQRDVMMTAAATAVGINMTFLFPYSILARKWTKEFRGLSIFDLGTGMFIPFVLATSFVVIAAASQFHTVPAPGFVPEQLAEAITDPVPAVGEAAAMAQVKTTPAVKPSPRQMGEYNELLRNRLSHVDGGKSAALSDDERAAAAAALSDGEKRLAATLVTRDAFDLAKALRPFTGDFFGDVIFGIGVLGMTLSTITILMLISGFVVCEMFGLPPTGWPHRLGTLAAATGALGPFFWSKAAFWLAVPTSVFGLILLPIAYWTFFLMMNSRSLLGAERPRGGARVLWNTLMITAASIATVASLVAIWTKAPRAGGAAIALFLGAVLIAHVMKKKRTAVS